MLMSQVDNTHFLGDMIDVCRSRASRLMGDGPRDQIQMTRFNIHDNIKRFDGSNCLQFASIISIHIASIIASDMN